MDLQEFAVDTQKFKDKANALRAERDQILQALDFVHWTPDPTSADFDSSSVDFLPSVQAFTSTVYLRLPAQHIRAVDERDDYLAANNEYAKHLRSVTADNARLLVQLSKFASPTTGHHSQLVTVFSPSCRLGTLSARSLLRRLQPRWATSPLSQARLVQLPTTPAGNARRSHGC